MTELAEESAALSMEDPYPPSWIDRLIAWIDRIPGPTWLFYVLSGVALAILGNAVFWIDGSLPFGSFDLPNTLFALLVLYWLALYQYLTRIGAQSLRSFRPLLAVGDSEFERIDYELSSLPRWLGWLTIPLGLGFAAASVLGDPEPFGDLVARTPIPYVVDLPIMWFLVSTFFCVIVRSIRQLRMVRELHSRATNINLLNLNPAHAFSALTARTGIGMVLLLLIALPIQSPGISSTTGIAEISDIFLTTTIIAVAIAIFVLPVLGIRHQIEEEKLRVLNEINTLLQAASDRLHELVRGDNFRNIGDTRNALEALIRERELAEKISTWPWDPRTLRGFASTLLLPIFLWLVTRLLEELI